MIMKSILLPTDFSALGDFAYSLASQIAQSTGATITALSVVPGPPDAAYSHKGILLDDQDQDLTELRKRLTAAKAAMAVWVGDKPAIAQTECLIGAVDSLIIHYAEDHAMDLIAMGSDGLSTKSLWSRGSHTEYITNHVDIPVLSLKCDRSDIRMDTIALFSDFADSQKINLKALLDLQAAFDSTLHLVRVVKPKDSRTDDELLADIELFARHNDLDQYKAQLYAAETVESGIVKYCASQHIDLVALGTHQSRGFARLFTSSISDDVVNHLYHPILTFPIPS